MLRRVAKFSVQQVALMLLTVPADCKLPGVTPAAPVAVEYVLVRGDADHPKKVLELLVDEEGIGVSCEPVMSASQIDMELAHNGTVSIQAARFVQSSKPSA